jgi:Ca-activated chloride channel homolog
MKLLRFPLAALPFLFLLVSPPQTGARSNSQEQAPTIRVYVDRVNVGVIVTDARGHFVEGLHRANFRVFDNGIEQPLTDFATINEPAQVLLVIEAGPAVYLLESGHLHAAYSLLSGLSSGDRVAVVKYAEAPQTILDFTPNKQTAAAALDQLHFNLGFGSLNLSSSLSKILEWLTNVKGKKTIVLLSTGVDTSASKESDVALERLKTSDVRLLAVSLTGGLQNPQPVNKKKAPVQNSELTKQQFEQANQLLKRLAEATGGRAYFPATAKEFETVYAEIAQLVRHEYSLAFAPPARDGAVHAVEVRIVAPQSTASNTPSTSYSIDHRRAYIAPQLAN